MWCRAASSSSMVCSSRMLSASVVLPCAAQRPGCGTRSMSDALRLHRPPLEGHAELLRNFCYGAPLRRVIVHGTAPRSTSQRGVPTPNLSQATPRCLARATDQDLRRMDLGCVAPVLYGHAPALALLPSPCPQSASVADAGSRRAPPSSSGAAPVLCCDNATTGVETGAPSQACARQGHSVAWSPHMSRDGQRGPKAGLTCRR